jgi:cytochrome b561
MANKVTGYSRAQIALHWTVVVLVAFQFLAHDGMEDMWRAFVRGEPRPEDDEVVMAYLHIAAGALVFTLALTRIYLRIVRGAPAPPADEPRVLQFLAEGIHGLIYLLLLFIPASGATAWFLGVEGAGDVHEFLTNVLLAAIALHVAGALFQHFVRRSDVLMRMSKPQNV